MGLSNCCNRVESTNRCPISAFSVLILIFVQPDSHVKFLPPESALMVAYTLADPTALTLKTNSSSLFGFNSSHIVSSTDITLFHKPLDYMYQENAIGTSRYLRVSIPMVFSFNVTQLVPTSISEGLNS